MQVDEAKENSPYVGTGDCSIVDDELDVALVAMLSGVSEPLDESLLSTPELVASEAKWSIRGQDEPQASFIFLWLALGHKSH